MNLIILDNWSDLQALRPAWLRLLAGSPGDSLFATPEWIESWVGTLGKQELIRFVAAFEDGDLAGLMPLGIARGNWRELGGRRLEFISGRRADYHDAIVSREREKEIIPRLMEEALRLLGPIGFMVLHHLPEDSANLPIFREMVAGRGFKYNEVVSTAPYLLLDRSLPNFKSIWHKSHRDDLRRQRNHLEKMGALSLHICHDPQQVLERLPGFFETHRRLWLVRGKRSRVGNDPHTQAFLRRLVTTLGCTEPQKRVHFSTLNLDDGPISYHFGFVYRDRFLYYVPTHRIELEKYSPGKVHLHYLIEHGLAHESWQVFDFMMGAESYKYQWTRTERKIYDLVVSKRSLLGAVRRWWLTSGKDRARDFLDKMPRFRLPRFLGERR